MTRRSLALLTLLAPLWACSPASNDAGVTDEAAPERVAPRAPEKTRQPVAPKRGGKNTLRAEAAGGYYQYVDESGKVRFAQSLDDVPERQRATAGHISVDGPSATRRSARSEARSDSPKSSSAHVVLYTTKTCGYCKRAIAYFDQIGQDYENKDVEDDDDARDEYLQLTKGNRGVPVIVINDEVLQGWSQPRVEQMLAAAK